MSASSEQAGTLAPPRPPQTQAKSDGATPTAASIGRWTGLRARLMLFITLVLLGPFWLITYLVYNHYERTRIETLRSFSHYATDMTSRDYGIGVVIRQLLVAFAQNENVLEYRSERCSGDARALFAAESRYASIGAVKLDGTVFCHSAAVLPQGQSMADREWFQEALAGKTLTQGHYVIGKNLGIPIVVFAYPTVEKGEIKAVVFAAFNLAWLSRSLELPLAGC